MRFSPEMSFHTPDCLGEASVAVSPCGFNHPMPGCIRFSPEMSFHMKCLWKLNSTNKGSDPRLHHPMPGCMRFSPEMSFHIPGCLGEASMALSPCGFNHPMPGCMRFSPEMSFHLKCLWHLKSTNKGSDPLLVDSYKTYQGKSWRRHIGNLQRLLT